MAKFEIRFSSGSVLKFEKPPKPKRLRGAGFPPWYDEYNYMTPEMWEKLYVEVEEKKRKSRKRDGKA
jgi:hypothetical protein